MLVATDSAVKLAPLRYKYLEVIRNRELTKNHGNYNANVILDHHAKELITWWIENIGCQGISLRFSPQQLEM